MVKQRYTKEQVIAQHEKNIAEKDYHVNQALQFLKNEIQDLKQAQSAVCARHGKTVADLNKILDDNEAGIKKTVYSISEILGDQQHKIEEAIREFRNELTNVKALYMPRSELDVLDELIANVNGFYEISTKHFHGFESSLQSAIANFESKLAEFTSQILSAPVAGLEQIPALHQKVTEAQIDKDGVLQELRALKKQVFIQSKYIEQLQLDLKKITPG